MKATFQFRRAALVVSNNPGNYATGSYASRKRKSDELLVDAPPRPGQPASQRPLPSLNADAGRMREPARSGRLYPAGEPAEAGDYKLSMARLDSCRSHG